MRAVLCKEWGEPESLVVEQVAPPPMRDGCVRIAVTGINFADILMVARHV
jgi:NADPH2:quinone reductase